MWEWAGGTRIEPPHLCERAPQGKNTDPVIARQFEQSQLNAATNSSETSYATALHAQRPLSTTTH